MTAAVWHCGASARPSPLKIHCSHSRKWWFVKRNSFEQRRAALAFIGLAGLGAKGVLAATPPAVPAAKAAPAAAPAKAAPVQPLPPIFVLNSLDASVSVIDPVRWVETARIPTGKEPHHLYLTPDEKSLVVANALGDSLTFLDPRTAQVQRVVRDISDPYHLRFSPDMKWLVTAANRLDHVDFYRWDGQQPTLAKRVTTAKTPSHLWIDARSTTVYSTMQDSDELVAIDLATQVITARVRTGAMPADVCGSPDGKRLYIGLTGSDSVEVFDISAGPPRNMALIKTGKGAHAFRGAGDKRHLYVSNRVANTIGKIDMQTQQLVETYPAPGGPDCMDVSADGRYIYVSSRWARKLSVIDTVEKKVVRQVNVGKSPHGVWTLAHAPR